MLQSAADRRPTATSQTQSGQRRNFAATLAPRLTPAMTDRSRKRHSERSAERERDRDVAGLHGGVDRGPEQRQRVAAPVAHAEDREHREHAEDEERLDREVGDRDGEERERDAPRAPTSGGYANDGYGLSPAAMSSAACEIDVEVDRDRRVRSAGTRRSRARTPTSTTDPAAYASARRRDAGVDSSPREGGKGTDVMERASSRLGDDGHPFGGRTETNGLGRTVPTAGCRKCHPTRP